MRGSTILIFILIIILAIFIIATATSNQVQLTFELTRGVACLPAYPNSDTQVLSYMFLPSISHLHLVYHHHHWYHHEKGFKHIHCLLFEIVDVKVLFQAGWTFGDQSPRKVWGRVEGAGMVFSICRFLKLNIFKDKSATQVGKEMVAVKIFPLQDKQSWFAEQEIYNLPQVFYMIFGYFLWCTWSLPNFDKLIKPNIFLVQNFSSSKKQIQD